MTGLTLYQAGPMRSRPYFNSVAFEIAATNLRAQGIEVVSPVEMDQELGMNFMDYPEGTEPLPEGFSLPELMRRDLEALTSCDGVVVMPGWQHSTGATVEVAYARFLGLPVYDLGEFL